MMIQEYLLLEDDAYTFVKQYSPEGVQKKIHSLHHGKARYVQFLTEGKNKDCARKLSCVDEQLHKELPESSFKTLKCECSEYFCTRLYPYVSGFERKLRNLLYMAVALKPDHPSSNLLSNLESMDFGAIFSTLFVDLEFVKKIKEEIKNKKQFSKDEIFKNIQLSEERLPWDSLLDKSTVPSLRQNHNKIKDYRNDVMHSHNISWNKYNECEKLFKAVNRELDEAIKLFTDDEEIAREKVSSSFNDILTSAIKAQDSFSKIVESYSEMVEAAKLSPQLQESIQHISKSLALDIPALQEFGRQIYSHIGIEQISKVIANNIFQNLNLPNLQHPIDNSNEQSGEEKENE